MPPETGDDPPKVGRSISLGADRLGLTAKLDLVATDGDEAVPVDTKRGRVPNTPERSYEPERVQLDGLFPYAHLIHLHPATLAGVSVLTVDAKSGSCGASTLIVGILSDQVLTALSS